MAKLSLLSLRTKPLLAIQEDICPASSKQGSDLDWGHLYVTAVLLIKKVAIWSWMMYDQKNELLFSLSYRGLPNWKNFWSLQNLDTDCYNIFLKRERERERGILGIFFRIRTEIRTLFVGKTKLKGLKEGILTFFLESLLLRKKILLFKSILKLKKGLLPKSSHFPTFSC